MDDARVWEFEDSLWKGSADHYRECVDQECLMVLPQPPYVVMGSEAIESVSDTPRWTKTEISEQKISRPQEGMIVVAYRMMAEREGVDPYEAHCTSTYRRVSHEHWQVVQHQQTPLIAIGKS
jgi:hypothetical protein